MVHKRERYIVGWTPRVKGYSLGKPSFSKYSDSSGAGRVGRALFSSVSRPGNATRGTSMPDEVSKRLFRSGNFFRDGSSVSCNQRWNASLRVILLPHVIARRALRYPQYKLRPTWQSRACINRMAVP